MSQKLVQSSGPLVIIVVIITIVTIVVILVNSSNK